MDVENKIKLIEFGKSFSGGFSNKVQSQRNPRLFANINIFIRPIKWSVLNGPGFYSEQSYNHKPWEPYRQAIHRVRLKQELFIIENYKLENPQKFAGSGFTPELLKSLDIAKKFKRVGCSMIFSKLKKGNYLGHIEKGHNCLLERDGITTYIESKVEIKNDLWISEDSGFDLNTHKKVWGARNGSFIFEKSFSFDKDINQKWLEGI